ncbi:hypothetical protein CTI12_AA235190 [Artemisia annua]|uniref:Bifunctional inhibitor/plant lipid transfer protein/seed storage helical domain-containing protein n=1 Tax=Artemisia annua TaxID=35608 RepID=A0A2U1NRP2_ARTAN|nr:hypothetical protein CTI12_AA235190 [Artemisia annua]
MAACNETLDKEALKLVPCASAVEDETALVTEIHGEGECGIVKLDKEALKLVPCASAVEDETALVTESCCKQVGKLVKNPECLCAVFCAVLLSDTAKKSKISPEIAMTIPKRCNIADRPIGYQCGGWFLD